MKKVLMILNILMYASLSLGQSSTGQLVGIVSGADGVIPEALVIVVDMKTGKERSVITSKEGFYSIPQLEVGLYSARVSAKGFKTYVIGNLKIDVGKVYSFNPTLELGSLQEQVSVIAGADTVNSTGADISNIISPQQLQTLPLNARNPLVWISLQAGSSSNGAQNLSINGQRSSFTNITRDGLNIQEQYIRQDAVTFSPERPTVDDVGELDITTQNSGANKGYGASHIEIVTPRGQARFHGSLFAYNRNSKFAANSFFENASKVERELLNRNQFGGRLSGVLPIPRFGEGGPLLLKKKIFFFGYYEGLRFRRSDAQLRTILLPSARAGDFNYIDEKGVKRTVNILSSAFNTGTTSIDPTIQNRILNIMPSVGNTGEAGDSLNTTGYRFNQKANTDRDSFTTRLDYEIDDRHSINGIFTHKEELNLRPDVDKRDGFQSVPTVFQPLKNRFLALAYRINQSSNFTNEIRGGFNQVVSSFERVNDPPPFFIAVPTLNGSVLGQNGVDFISNPEVRFLDQGRNSDSYNIQDNAVYIRRNHSFSFGGSAQFFRINAYNNNGPSSGIVPTYFLGTNYNPIFLSAEQFPGGIDQKQLNVANNLLAVLGGRVGIAQQIFNVTSRSSGFVPGAPQKQNFAFENYGLYLADQWQVNPRLTLNFGLRYEVYTALREENGLVLEPVISNDPIISILDPYGKLDFIGRNVGKPNQFYRTDYNNFGPVISFAYAPQFKNKLLGLLGSGRTVIRGGIRISYVNDELVASADNTLSSNNGLQVTSGIYGMGADINNIPSIKPPKFKVPITYAENYMNDPNSSVYAIDPSLRTPSVLEYNFGVQHELGFQTTMEVRYVGSLSNNLLRGVDYNQVIVRENGFAEDFNRARSNLLLAAAQRKAEIAQGIPTHRLTMLTGAYQQRIAGSQRLKVIQSLRAGGSLEDSAVIDQLLAGTPADLAYYYIFNLYTGRELLTKSVKTSEAGLLANSGRYRYHSLQAELRRRFHDGLYLQANYTFQKTLTNAIGTKPSRFEPLLDNNQPQLEYSRADYDQTQVFNLNTTYELPFGKNRRFFNNKTMSQILRRLQVSSIMRVATGAPISIVDPRGTLNRTERSFRQTAISFLSKKEIKDLIGVYRRGDGIYYINPSVIDPISRQASNGFDSKSFPGQVFFNVAPGEIGNLERNFINGPLYFNWDAGIIKTITLSDNATLQLRAEAFNVLNRTNFRILGPFDEINQQNGPDGIFNVNSPTFGRIKDTFEPRVMQFSLRLEF
jgi:hypothetical protein